MLSGSPPADHSIIHQKNHDVVILAPHINPKSSTLRGDRYRTAPPLLRFGHQDAVSA